ncbi:ATP-dependent RNA helicase HrpA [Salinisphaera sp. USBA-960]|uniref:ATP-dependent RNA helicase HrpA n=1 Tax=Salinisphaera orenii TaxID=856731 RepID=UPI000DBE70D9|nr:ATP-dependent RNA helicase HrpA [Salifodinibacter halophilus]NNC26117.1 ATP-dependent RNA helicase HrpA [Salifodinibacter halophilus]
MTLPPDDNCPDWIDSGLWSDRTTRDRHRLSAQAHRATTDTERNQVHRSVEKSAAITRDNRAQRPDVAPNAGLPVSTHADAIVDALQRHRVVVVCGETGSGKTTQLPQILMRAGWGDRGRIGHTQPRRLAARNVAERIAEEVGSQPGELAGFVTRFDKQISNASRIKLMTDGVLLAESAQDRYLTRYETIIVDEAHERTLNVDFLLGYLKRLLPSRPDLKVVITSATIDPDRFSRFFNDAPVINVEGRRYPVTLSYRPPAEDTSLAEAIESAVGELWRQDTGDVLVFLPGERDIRDTERHLARSPSLAGTPGLEIVPLYARLTRSAQQRIFAPSSGKRIVLATNVAETSLTVPGIRYVVDSGIARISRYSPTARVQQLPIEAISQASASQRAGRCGRVAPGVCIRLFSEDDFNARPAFTDPEIQRTNLASVLLTMADLKLGPIERFEFIDPPAKRPIKDGRNLLTQLGALVDNQITSLGRQLARLPLDPRLARMLLAGTDTDAPAALRVLAAGLTIVDPRERPADSRAAADESQAAFTDSRSDFVGLLKLWDAFAAARREYRGNQLRQWCRQRYLNFMRLREWEDLVRQLRQTSDQLELATQPGARDLASTDYRQLHEAILTGLVDHVGHLDTKHDYRGIRNRRFRIFPGSGLAGRQPKWIVAAELVETRRLYAHYVATIEPAWVERVAPHLVAVEHYGPRWSKRRGQVIANERVRLFGLTLIDGRRRNFGAIDPASARQVFIHEALVPHAVHDRRGRLPAFLAHNREQLQAVADDETRLRRVDLQISETELAELYEARLPAEVVDRTSLTAWLKKHDDAVLRFNANDLRRDGAPTSDAANYPDAVDLGGVRAPVHYRFEPGAEDDGVTIRIPLPALNDISVALADWHVPGLLTELFTEYLRALPKRLRREFVPIPETARAAAERSHFGIDDPDSALRDALRATTGVEVPTDAWQSFEPSPHLKTRFEIVDESDHVIESGRDLSALRASFGERAAQALADQADDGLNQHGLTDWPDVDLSADVDVAPSGVSMHAAPTLIDRGEAVDLTLQPPGDNSWAHHRQGVIRLVRLAANRITRRIKRERIGTQALRATVLPTPPATARVGSARWASLSIDPEPLLFADLLTAVIGSLMDDVPRTRATFDALVKTARGNLETDAVTLWSHVAAIIEKRDVLIERLDRAWPTAAEPALADMREQLDHLVYAGVIGDSTRPIAHMRRLARYLRGIEIRLDKLKDGGAAADKQLQRQVEPYWRYYQRIATATEPPGIDIDLFRLLIEEFRIQLFAQALGTEAKVSAKRLERMIGNA